MGCFRFFGKIIALALLLVFIIVLPITLWLFNAQRVAFSPAMYQRVLDNPRVYSELVPALLPPTIQDIEDVPNAPPEVKRIAEMVANLGGDDWLQITDLLAPAPWMQEQVQSNITGAFYWLDKPQVAPGVGLDMAAIKGRVQGEEGREVVQIIVNSWPPCSADQQEQMQRSLEAGPESDIPLPFCQPEGRLLAPLTEDIGDLVVFIADEFPDRVPQGKAPGETLTAQERSQFLNLKFLIRVVRRVAYLIFIIPLIFLVLVEIVAVRSFKSLWLWYGWSLFLGGLASLVPLLVLPLALWQAVTVIGHQAGPSGLRVMFGFMNVFSLSFGQPVLVQAVAIAGMGLVLLAMGAVTRYPEDKLGGAGAGRYTYPSPNPPQPSPEMNADTAISDRTRPVPTRES